MKIITYTTTTSDNPYLDYLKVTLKSYRRFNDNKVVVFVLDDGVDKIKLITNNYNNIEVINFSKNKTSDYIKSLPSSIDCSKTFSFDNSKLVNILIGPECLDYMYNNYDYDILYRTDTDVIYNGYLDFNNFYNSNKAFGGCKEYEWKKWALDTFKYIVPIEDDVLNVGMSCFRKDKQIPNTFDKMKELLEEWNYKFNTYEQDVINYIYQGSKYDLNNDGFYLGVNKKHIYKDIRCNTFHFVSSNLKPYSLSISDKPWYDWILPIIKKYTSYSDKYIEYEYKKSFLDEKLMKIAFYSSCTNDEKFIDMGIATISSYLRTNNLEIDWIIIGNSEEDNIRNKERMNFLEEENLDRLHLRYVTMPADDVGLDYHSYNTFNWTSDKASEIFLRRIKFVDEYKDQYDVMVCVDFDIIFTDDVVNFIEEVYFSDSIEIAGQQEPFMLEYGLKKLMNINDIKIPYDISGYINFGFGILNCKLLRNDNWNHFINMSKGKEYYWNTQEQAYFCSAYNNKQLSKNLQMLIYPRIVDKSYRTKNKFKMIHFTPCKFITTKLESNSDLLKFDRNNDTMLNFVCFCYFDFYYTIVKESKGISKEFLEIIEHNKKIIDAHKKKYHTKISLLRLYFGL